MVYITVMQSPKYHQMTLEELLFEDNPKSFFTDNKSNTRTYATEKLNEKFKRFDIDAAICTLHRYNESIMNLMQKDRHSLYHEFRIKKQSGGFRKISAPEPELKDALYRLKLLFEGLGALYHTSSFAYVKDRCTLDAIKRHQWNESKWFAKFDVHDFFGSTTKTFLSNMLSMIYPFSEIMSRPDGAKELNSALEIAFLDGGLPQGSPLSPMLTNLMMIPIDYALYNTLRDYNKQRYVYTRYADDFLISSKYDFNYREIEALVNETFKKFNAPFELNAKKTRYGSSAGRNWNLGVMLNAENNITVGAKKKREFKAMLTSYILDRKNGIKWDIGDIQYLEGLRSYYTMVEGSVIDEIISKLSRKFEADIMGAIKDDMRGV